MTKCVRVQESSSIMWLLYISSNRTWWLVFIATANDFHGQQEPFAKWVSNHLMVPFSISASFWEDVKPCVSTEVSIMQQSRVIYCIYNTVTEYKCVHQERFFRHWWNILLRNSIKVAVILTSKTCSVDPATFLTKNIVLTYPNPYPLTLILPKCQREMMDE